MKKYHEWLKLREIADISTNASQAGMAVKDDLQQVGGQAAAGLQSVVQTIMMLVQNNPGSISRIVSALQSGVNGCQMEPGQKKQVMQQLMTIKQQLNTMQNKDIGTNPPQNMQQQPNPAAIGNPVLQMPPGGMTQPIYANPQ